MAFDMACDMAHHKVASRGICHRGSAPLVLVRCTPLDDASINRMMGRGARRGVA